VSLEPIKNIFKPDIVGGVVDSPHELLHVFDFPTDVLSEIQELVTAIITKGIGPAKAKINASKVNFINLLETLRKTKVIELERDPDLFTILEGILIKEISKVLDIRKFKGIEFPVNVRVVHPVAPDGYLLGANPTDLFHCDPWAGEPDDIINVLLYLYCSPKSSRVQFINVSPMHYKAIKEHKGSYRSIQHFLSELPLVNLSAKSGQVLVFNSFLPHATKRGIDDIRISIDFRLRKSDPYKTEDSKWLRKKIPWSKYWFLPTTDFSTYQEKYSYEIKTLRSLGDPKPIHLRRKA